MRLTDEAVLAEFRGSPCVVCGRPSDPCHIRSRGAGGPDARWNLMALCRMHHSQQHANGWSAMSEMYPKVHRALIEKGWTFEQRGLVVKLKHKLD